MNANMSQNSASLFEGLQERQKKTNIITGEIKASVLLQMEKREARFEGWSDHLTLI